MNKKVIILFGPPGAGKGTQAGLLAEKLNLYYLETSKVLEEKFKEAENLSGDSPERFVQIGEERYDVLSEKDLWKKGLLCSPPFVSFLIKNKLRDLFEMGWNLILAGSPRTVFEGKEVIPLLKELYGKESIKVVLLEISPKETIFRNTNRRICELMRHPILYQKETKKLTICPLDGSKLMKRKGLDDPKVIKVRLQQYKDRTFPLLEYFKGEGLEIKKINGEQPVSAVFKDILKAIKL